MANQNSKIDDNRRHTLMGVTDDAAAELRRLIVDPTTGALKCTAVLSDVSVAQGGTGLTSLTAYAVLTGGTTATGAMQQVSGLGSAGQVLTSNGAGALPSWQAAASAGANAALSNLASVAINAALIPGTAGALDIGSTAKPWADLWIAGTSGTPATNQFKVTGASTGGVRTITLPDASITVNAAADLSGTIFGENVITAILDDALSADGKFSGITENGTAGATLAFGDLCYLNDNDSRWELVDANLSDGYDKKLGICVLAAANDGDATRMLLWGKVRADGAFPTLTIGAPVYMSETAGDVVVTQPSTADVAIRVVGFGNTSDELFFCPSPDYAVHI